MFNTCNNFYVALAPSQSGDYFFQNSLSYTNNFKMELLHLRAKEQISITHTPMMRQIVAIIKLKIIILTCSEARGLGQAKFCCFATNIPLSVACS